MTELCREAEEKAKAAGEERSCEKASDTDSKVEEKSDQKASNTNTKTEAERLHPDFSEYLYRIVCRSMYPCITPWAYRHICSSHQTRNGVEKSEETPLLPTPNHRQVVPT